MYPPRPASFSLIVALLFACGDPTPPAPIVELPQAGDTVNTHDSDVTGAAWLGGQRWAVLAAPNETAAIADFSSGTLRPLGKGADLKSPTTLFVAGDSLYVGDWGLRRTTVWTLSGRLARSFPSSEAARGSLPLARDLQGRFYTDLYPRPGSDGSGNRDSAVVLRADPTFTRADTIAHLAPLDIAEIMAEGGRRFERRVFGGVDRWGVLIDGSVWVARVYENRVDWRSADGKWTRGQALPDRVLEVTRYDRELFIQGFPPELRGTAQQLPFAPIKPPFEAAFTGNAGHVWLEKSRAPADSARTYHVVDRTGRLAREIRLQGRGRVLAVSDSAALVVERTPDGTRLLQLAVSPASSSH